MVQSRPPRFLRQVSAGAVAAVCLAILLASAPPLPMAWDEGNAIYRAAGIQAWFGELRGRGSRAFTEDEIARHWHYTVEVEGHPALYGIAIAVGQWLGAAWLSPLTALRLGPMMLFAVATGAMFYRLARRYSLFAAVAGVAALLTMPRLFAHAHFASFDGPLTACWILAWAAFAAAAEEIGTPRPSPEGRGSNCGSPYAGTPRGPAGAPFPTEPRAPVPRLRVGLLGDPRLRVGLLWGVALGATMSCKFTGWLAPLPFLAWAAIYGNRKSALVLGAGLAAALVTFWVVNPGLWHRPIDGIRAFFDLNLNRAGTRFDIPTLFFDNRYTTATGLPWYNTLVWTAVTVPLPTLCLAAVGIATVLRRWTSDASGMLIVLNWVPLLVVRASPGAPVHDAERLILPSFAFLAMLAGVGCHALLIGKKGTGTFCRNGPEGVSHKRFLSPFSAIVLAFLGSASSLVWYAPQWLSYYSLLIGGLRGADAAGMEATYYWDALDHEVLDWLHAHTAEDEKIAFSSPSGENLTLMREWGTLRRGWRPDEPGRYRWHVVQRRPTFWSSDDRWLIEHGAPAFRKTIRRPNWGIGPWRLDVPLIEIFPGGVRRELGISSREIDNQVRSPRFSEKPPPSASLK